MLRCDGRGDGRRGGHNMAQVERNVYNEEPYGGVQKQDIDVINKMHLKSPCYETDKSLLAMKKTRTWHMRGE